jgi:hypothetical protein
MQRSWLQSVRKHDLHETCSQCIRVLRLIMIRKSAWRKFEADELRREQLDLEQKFRLIDALYAEARALGVLPMKDPLDGLSIDIRIAKVINHVSKAA